ncbi:hypothetical protein QE152_g35049 [Popillia japonica]|uniref:Uncharacterized protein n=1 Tax=Popillia japonica TaxID=7064 RepID=A0AAW1ISV9_POPJA
MFLQSQRTLIVERANSYGNECKDVDISIERTGRRKFRKRTPGVMAQCLDRFYGELDHRYMDDILITFGVVQPKILPTSTEEELRGIVQILRKSMMNLLQKKFYD